MGSYCDCVFTVGGNGPYEKRLKAQQEAREKRYSEEEAAGIRVNGSLIDMHNSMYFGSWQDMDAERMSCPDNYRHTDRLLSTWRDR